MLGLVALLGLALGQTLLLALRVRGQVGVHVEVGTRVGLAVHVLLEIGQDAVLE